MSVLAWQMPEWKVLLQALHNQRLAHAILLSSEKNSNHVQFAKVFAQQVLCEKAIIDKLEKPCDECKSCHLIQQETHPDLQLITLAEDASVIKLDQIKNLIAHMSNTAQYQSYKIAIIYPAEKMNIHAANALLKNLEEPIGSHVLFFLVTEHYAQLPITIRSRCQRLHFHHTELENYPTELAGLWQQLAEQGLSAITDISQKFSKHSTVDIIESLQSTLANMRKSNAKINNMSLYQLWDTLIQDKQAIDAGIQLNQQLLLEQYLIKFGVI